MACLKPILVHNITKGQRVQFWRPEDEQVYEYDRYLRKDVFKEKLNREWETNQYVPCRKCNGCKLDNARQWAIRSALHVQIAPENNWFITLTYNDVNLPRNKNGHPTIRHGDLTRFINSIRKHFERRGITGIKYLAGAEYGSRTKRPHYHICFFCLPLYDLVPSKRRSTSGSPYFQSDLVNRLWNFGFTEIGEVSYQSAGYVARYTLKKMSKVDYETLEIEPEKIRMSKGIGLNYFEANWDKIYPNDLINIKIGDTVKRVVPPIYFDKKLEMIDPDMLRKVKDFRYEKARSILHNFMKNADGVSFSQMLGNKQHDIAQRSKRLKRVVSDSEK